MFKYSTFNNTITSTLNIVPSNSDIIIDVTNDYTIFKNIFKKFLNNVYNVKVNDEVVKKIFLEVLMLLNKDLNESFLSVNSIDIIRCILLDYNDIEEDINFEDITENVDIDIVFKNILSKYPNYIFIDYIVYKQHIKILVGVLNNENS